MSELGPRDDAESAGVIVIGILIVIGVLMFAAAMCGDAVECANQTCPAEMVPALVQSYSNLSGVVCTCVLQ